MSIPISSIVSVLASTLAAGGNALALSGLILTENVVLPFGAPLSFPSAETVSDYFGASSDEAEMASIYFNGYEGATSRPAFLLFSRFAGTAIGAFTRGNTNTQTLAQLQAITAGSLSVKIDGVTKSSNAIDLSTATSFSNAAALITTALTLSGGAAVTYDANFQAFVISSGTTGATSLIEYATGALATTLALTAAAGAVISQGSDIQTPSAAMTAITDIEQNWAGFTSVFEPDLDGKKGFSTWTNGTAGRFFYAPWDTDATAAQAPGSYTGLGAWLRANNVKGVYPFWNSKLCSAAALGWAASLDFNRVEGRATLAFRVFDGMAATVSDLTSSANLIANGFNFYGNYANPSSSFVFMYPGQSAYQLDGNPIFLDSYVGQIWLDANIQLSLLELLLAVGTVPYNDQGFGLMHSAVKDPIDTFKAFGGIRAGVPLSALQKAEVNLAAGVDISQDLFNVGWYFQVLQASAPTRAARQTPPSTLWYMDGQSVQQITLNSINIQ